ncbi:TlpA family protein disulfide reductase [Halorubrum laminariae]|uniref:TlpA family protein disulfide reductase n=1 Tax=Halorubrum laminariae TaxID=1433523 RepID=A0ABD6C4J6_9EURY|nr:thioredoxin family protein [Halorubrum laminariae]
MTTATETVDELVTTGVIEVTPTGIAPSDEFRATVSERCAAIEDGRDDALADLPVLPEALRAADVDPRLLATYATLRERHPNLSTTRALVASVLLDSSKSGPPPASGAPEGFVPVHGEDAVRLVDLCDRCVVYVWRDDCPPCESMRPNLSDVFGTVPPEGVLALSVYGPDCAALLDEEYDIVGGPTTLFTLEGRVDTRFVGVAETDSIEREIETLRERSLQSS